jgi:sigma-B regulation protein RsbU (phosphoserine phosphatase)
MGSTSLRPGDTLLLYTDGVTECLDASGDEFGPERLSEVARRGVGRPAQAVLDDIVDALRAFGLPEQGDDMTLIVAKRRSS